MDRETSNLMKKKLPIGIDSFEKLRREDFYYVDKTAMIRDLLYQWGEVNLFTRPRRFGKSLNMSMLKSFFEIGCDQTLFEDLSIAKEAKLCETYMGKFPVISISLKSVNGNDFQTARSMLCSTIGHEAMHFPFLLEDENLTIHEKQQYEQLVHVDTTNTSGFIMPDAVVISSLKTLSHLLEKHYAKKVIILIDEYDVPLAKANENGYYDQMVTLIRSFLEQAFKTNESLYFAVLTGCLRVAKESIFTGLNNIKIFSLTNIMFDEYFGFTSEEVDDMFTYYEVENKYQEAKEWYDGYRFGNLDVYCPWDVICYLDVLKVDPTAPPQNYWSNTSSNDVVRHFIEKVDKGVSKGEIEALIAGETVTKTIYQELTYHNLYDSIEHLWSVLFSTGYLTQRQALPENRYQLAIPNREIQNIFKSQIMGMFRQTVASDTNLLQAFCHALQSGHENDVERIFTDYLGKTISIRDTFSKKMAKENFYHGLLLGILGCNGSWLVTSNQETGDGYCDILIKIESADIGIIIEVKYAENGGFAAACQEALHQIDKRDYAAALKEDGYTTIHKYGIACFRKKCRVALVTETNEDFYSSDN